MHGQKKLRRIMLVIALVGQSLSAHSAEVKLTTQEELAKLYKEDQDDRRSTGSLQDWEAVGMRDEARELRVKELLAAGPLGSGQAYYHAAMILQHAGTPDDYLLAHDLSVIAISKGEVKAKWLAAASLDRFLMSVGRPQRYGTQYRSTKLSKPPQLYLVDPSVSDVLRTEMDVPTLAQAKIKEIERAKAFADAKNNKK